MSSALLASAPTFEFKPYLALDDATLTARIAAVKAELGPRLLVLGQDLSRNDKRDLAIGELRGLVTELANFRSLPGEDEANFAGGVATGAKAPATQVPETSSRGGWPPPPWASILT